MKDKNRTLAAAAIVATALAGSGYGFYQLGMKQAMGMASRAATATAPAPVSAATADPSAWTVAQGEAATRRHIQDGLGAGDVDPATGRRILYYHDPMVPGKKFDAPAKSPFMDMMLVPVYAGTEGADNGTIIISPRIQQNLGLRTAPVVEGTLSPQVSAVGSITWNERDQAIVQARATGYVERLHVRASLDRVAKGQPLVDLYVPEWVAAQEEFLSVRRMQGTDLAPLVDAARQRMLLVGMTEKQVRSVEASERVQPRLTIVAPIGGVVTELMVREGMTVMPGMTLFRLNGLGTVWAEAEVPESQAALLRPGVKVVATSPAIPGVSFEGRVQALLPEVNAQTRTLRARMEIANRQGRLVPGMFVQMSFAEAIGDKTLLVPSEAVIQTGRRAVVMLAEEGGRFRPTEVEPGLETAGQTEIRKGLQAGQRVVLSGQFLIDSEASLKGLEGRLNADPAPATSGVHRTEAKVEALKGNMVTLSHPPIPSLEWPAMTMDFQVDLRDRLTKGIRAGAQVEVEFRMQDDGLPQITKIQPIATARSNPPRGPR